MDSDKPIRNLADAKEFYWQMGCNGFHMFREFPERYHEYSELKISSEIEEAWRQELADELYARVMRQRKQDNGGVVLFYLDIVDMTPDNIKKSYKLIKSSYKHISPLYNVVIAEQVSNTGYLFPLNALFSAKTKGLNGLFRKYIKLIQKMLLYACKKDRSLLERAKHIFSPRTDIDEMISFIHDRIQKYQEPKE